MKRKTFSKNKLLETIRVALDCQSHFHKPTIINNDKDFCIGENAIVICDQCVERMRKAIGLKKGEHIPTNFAYFYEVKGKLSI